MAIFSSEQMLELICAAVDGGECSTVEEAIEVITNAVIKANEKFVEHEHAIDVLRRDRQLTLSRSAVEGNPRETYR